MVNEHGTKIRAVLLTEDGQNGKDVLKEMVRHLVQRGFDRKAKMVEVEVVPMPKGVEVCMQGNKWKERGQKQIDFVQSIATELVRYPDCVVVVHVDGDAAWGNRDERENSNRKQWLDRIQIRIGQHAPKGWEQRILIVEPFYSMEAWLYQNAEVLDRWVTEHFGGNEAEFRKLREWRDTPELLDEVEKPKEACCVRSSANLELAQHGFPSKKLMEIQKSFYACATEFAENPFLQHLRT